MKNVILLLLLMVAIVPSVLASTPDFSSSELLEDEVLNGESDFGDILFISKAYIPDYHPKALIGSDSFQQYDIMNWQGQSIRVNNPIGEETILISGSQYYFDRVGIYTLTSMLNSSESDFITIINADENLITIDNIILPNGFEMNLSQTSFVLTNEKSISASIDVDDDIKSGGYDISMDINGITLTKQVEVLKNINWTYDDTNLTKYSTVKAGTGLYIGRIIIDNNGNEDVEMIVTKEGENSDMIGIPQPQTLYRKNTLNFDFQVEVPTIRKSGVYDFDLIISGGGISKVIPINITVIDAINPRIESINFSTDKVFVDNHLEVVATDNDVVEKVTLEYDGQKFEFNKDGNLFTLENQFTKLSRYILNFCAYDIQTNEHCVTINKTFVKVNIIEGNEQILNMDSMRYGKYSKISIFNITDVPEGDVVVTLLSYDKQGSQEVQPIFRIVDAEGRIKSFGEYEKSVILTNVGEYFLEIRADEETLIDGVLRVDIFEQYEGIPDMTFKVAFKDYDVPKDFEIPWVNGRDLICGVIDTGNLDTSYYDCNLRYPIDTREADISIPTTVAEKNKFEADVDEVREEMKESKRKSGWIIGIISSLLLIVIGWSTYMILYYPYMRVQSGKTKSTIMKD